MQKLEGSVKNGKNTVYWKISTKRGVRSDILGESAAAAPRNDAKPETLEPEILLKLRL